MGTYSLWELPGVGYVSVSRAEGTITENRADVGAVSVPFLRSDLAGGGQTLLVDWGGAGGPRRGGQVPLKTSVAVGRPGTVVSQQARLTVGTAEATVQMDHPGLVVLSASFDPGWHVTVDGTPSTPVMVAPALVAVRVGTGIHRIVFQYVGYAGFPFLLVVSAIILVGAFVAERWWVGRAHRQATKALSS